ncbi:hypothetical protein Psyaliredsea_19540 [Psychrobacter alimentarius]
MKNTSVSIEEIRQFLYREARLLDEKNGKNGSPVMTKTARFGCRVGMTMAS